MSVLFGKFNTDYTQQNTTTTVIEATSNWANQRVVPILDYEVGLSWISRSGRWRLSSGYYTAFWFNAITTPEYVQAVQNADFVHLGDTIAFTGLTSKVEFRY